MGGLQAVSDRRCPDGQRRRGIRVDNVGAAQSTKVAAARSISSRCCADDQSGCQSYQSVGRRRSLQRRAGRTSRVGRRTTRSKRVENFVIGAGRLGYAAKSREGAAAHHRDEERTERSLIKGKDITIDGSGKINVKAASDIVIKGSKINQN